jgi:ribonuclease HI
MAPPKFIIAKTYSIKGNFPICLLRRVGKKWHIHKLLREETPTSAEETKSLLSQLSQELKIPWTKKCLKNVEYIQQRNAARKARRLEREPEKLPILFFDGTSTNRQGKSASAAVIVMPDQSAIKVQKFLPSASCSVAEYTGLIIGLEKALELGITRLIIRGDSQLVIAQSLGKYSPSNSSDFNCHQQVIEFLSKFDFYSLNWIPRAKNQLADRAASKCFKEHNNQEAHPL